MNVLYITSRLRRDMAMGDALRYSWIFSFWPVDAMDMLSREIRRASRRV